MVKINANIYEKYKKPGTMLIETSEQIHINDGLFWFSKLNLIETNETKTLFRYDAHDDSGRFIGIFTHKKNKAIDGELVAFQTNFRIRFLVVEIVNPKKMYEHVYNSKLQQKVISHYDNSYIKD